MKKSIILFTVALGLLTSCDPIKEEKDFTPWLVTSSEIESAVKISQVDADGKPAADGNYFNYTTSPDLNVTIFNKLADGSENILARGMSGSFSIKPKRGSDPNQKFWIRVVGSDNQPIDVEKTVNVYVKQELDPEMRLLASDAYGKKIWKWDTSIGDGEFWGNMGYMPGDGASVGTAGNGKWWGMKTDEDFAGQLNHSHDGAYHGEGLNAWMEFTDEGISTCYNEDGKAYQSGTFTVTEYNPDAEWRKGWLNTKAILWPYEINSGGNIPGKYEIVYLTADKLCLVYPDGGEQAAWGEATFWHFCSSSDFEGMAVGYGKSASKSWTWDQSIGDGEVWGNMGYMPGDGASVGLTGNGKWWGCKTEEDFAGQLAHSNDGALHGDESMNAYFTLDGEGNITRHAGDGSVINKGTYSFDKVEGDSWKVATFNTTAGTILWPFEINSGGNMPTWFDVVYLTNDKMTLVYPDGGSQGAWAEASFWHFKAK